MIGLGDKVNASDSSTMLETRSAIAIAVRLAHRGNDKDLKDRNVIPKSWFGEMVVGFRLDSTSREQKKILSL